MKWREGVCVISSFFVVSVTQAQNVEEKPVEKPTVKLSGYVRTESMYDSYLSVDSRDGELHYYPKRVSLDGDGNDRNEINQFTILGLQSRLRFAISGGSAFGSKLSGVIEGDFNGSSDTYKFNFRLRHAYFKMDWTKIQVLAGQYWHPLNTDIIPNTVAMGAGVVFNPLNRLVQFRATYTISDKMKVMGAIASYSTHHPIEPTGTNTQRNSGLPEMDLQLQMGSSNSLYLAITGGYKYLRPYLVTANNLVKVATVSTDSVFTSTQVVGSYHLGVTGAYINPLFSVKAQCILGENLTMLSMIGGYAPVKGSVNSRGEYDYANMKTVATWFDFEFGNSHIRPGLFIGFSKNLGTADSVEFVKKTYDDKITVNTKTDLCRDADLSVVYRLAPRVYFINGPVELGLEYTLTGANYGTFLNKEIVNVTDKSVGHRFMLTLKYSF